MILLTVLILLIILVVFREYFLSVIRSALYPDCFLSTGSYKLGGRQNVQQQLPWYSQKIPFVIHQTYFDDKMDVQLYETCMINRYMNVEYEYKFYTDKDVAVYVATHFPQYNDLFHSLIPGAFRADLFRYLVLYREGGVYMDCKSSTIIPLREFLPADLGFVSFTDMNTTTIQISFLASTPGHPVLGQALEIAFDNIRRQNYGVSAMDITGPQVCGRAFNRCRGVPDMTSIDSREYPEIDACILGTLKLEKKYFYEVLVDADERPLVSRACYSYYLGRLDREVTDLNNYGWRWRTGRVFKKKG